MDLSLQIGNVKCAPIHQLASGWWPKLEILYVSKSQLGEAATDQGKWPWQTCQLLSSNASVSTAAVALLPKAASWAPLRHLTLMRMTLDSSSTHSIALLHYQLEGLKLACTDMAITAFSRLTARPWPQLAVLELMGNRLTADAMASFV